MNLTGCINAIKPLIFIACLFAGLQMLQAQQFQNLNFQGQLANGSIPGWTALSYPYPDSPPGPGSANVQLDSQAIDDSVVSVVDSSWYLNGSWSFSAPGVRPVQGSQSLYMSSMPNGRIASISQFGAVPSGTMSIDILARDPDGEGVNENGTYTFPVFNLSPINVTFNGSDLILTPIAEDPSSNPSEGPIVEYAANISAWAGTSGNLSLGVDGFPASDGVVNVPAGESWAEIDDIWFSDVAAPAVPEARSFAFFAGLMCLGMAGLKLRRPTAS